MSETNSITLASYENRSVEYVDNTPHEASAEVKQWLDQSVEDLHGDARILEIGSAFGRDADYIEAKGFSVERTDAALAFVKLLHGQGHQARQLNILTDEIESEYDLIFADAVLLHFSRPETSGVLSKIHDSLSKHGRLAFTVKRGEGEGWSEAKLNAPRFFCYWQPEGLNETLQRAGFSSNSISSDENWLHVIADKGVLHED